MRSTRNVNEIATHSQSTLDSAQEMTLRAQGTHPLDACFIGALGATALALGYRKLNLTKLWNVCVSTFNTTAYIFAIFLGATVFSYVLRELGGDELMGAATNEVCRI